MTLINIPAFSGLNILAAPQRIREDEATIAIGCDFRSLDLRPFQGDAPTSMGTTNTGGIISNGASIFQWDADTWVGALGDMSFARSPTFYADGSTGQRIFVSDNDAPNTSDWDWVQDVVHDDLLPISGRSQSFALDQGVEGIRRLGVPKPGDIAAPTHIPREGTVDQWKRSTKEDTTLQVDALSASGLKKYDSIILSVPGIGDGPYTVKDKDDGATPTFTIGNSRLTYVQVPTVIAGADLVATFNKNDHGLADGQQVIINRTGDTPTEFVNKLPATYRTMLYNVTVEGANKFTLTLASNGLPFKLTSAASTGSPMKYAVVALADDPIVGTVVSSGTSQPVGSVWVRTYDGNALQQYVTYKPPAEPASTWVIALDTLVDRSYVVTWVNEFGDESEPSNPTKTAPVAQGDTVTFKTLPVAAASYPTEFGSVAMTDYRKPTEIRIYRTDALGTYRLVTTGVTNDAGDVNGTTRKIEWSDAANNDNTAKEINWVDTYPDTELGEPLATIGWQVPPKDINGILITPGGSLAGYRGRSVFGSVPYAPYAFPISNRVAFDYAVVGLVATSAGLVVVTEGHPALVVGDDPATWSIQKLEYPYGCVSRRSIVDMGELAIYASADGLVGIAGAGVEILTKDTLTRAQWQERYNPSAIIAAHAEGRYYGITTVGTIRKAFMFDPRTRSFIDLAAIDMTGSGPFPIALYTRLTDDTLLLLKSDGYVYYWNRGDTAIPYTWRSKAFQLTRPEIMGCCQIVAPAMIANWDFIFRLYGWDGEGFVLIATFSTETVTNDPPNRQYRLDKNVNPFRLPLPVDRYTAFMVELEGTLPIAQIAIAGVMDELRQV